MQENLRVFSNKFVSSLKTACKKITGGIKNSAYILIPVIMLLSVGIIALTQEEPSQANNFSGENEEEGSQQDISSAYETERITPEWVKPARWFRSNSGGMPIEEAKSRIAAMRSEYALLIDFTGFFDLPEHLIEYYDDEFFIETRTLYKNGKQNRTQWIFRDENYGVRLIAVLIETEKKDKPVDESASGAAAADAATSGDTSGAASGVTVVLQNTGEDNAVEAVEITAVQNEAEGEETDRKEPNTRKRDPINGFIEVYDEKYHLTTEYSYSEKGDQTKIEYFYNNNMKVSAKAMLWDDKKWDYIHTHTDYYRYNRSSFLRTVERVFMMDQKITVADNVVMDETGTEEDNAIKVSFPTNVIAAARGNIFMGERFNTYPEFFGDLLVLKDSKLVLSTDDHGRVLDQTLISNDEKQTVIWKIVNTWSKDRIVKITKTEGDTVLLAEYEYNKNGDRILERNIRDGVLERVVRTDGKTDIEELYLDNKLVLKAVWEDGRKISESRVTKN